MGWKGVGVGEAFGATVTHANTGADGAGAAVPHPARRNPARNRTRISFLIRYCEGVGGVFVAVGTTVQVDVGTSVSVAVAVGSCVGVEVLVGTLVAVAVGVAVEVSVGNSGMMVTPGTGVRVGIFGTHNLCPA